MAKNTSDNLEDLRAVLILLCMLMMIFFLASACHVPAHALRTEGRIIKSDIDRVFVVFEDALTPDRFHGEWFYIPRAGIVDMSKYKVKINLIQINDEK